MKKILATAVVFSSLLIPTISHSHDQCGDPKVLEMVKDQIIFDETKNWYTRNLMTDQYGAMRAVAIMSDGNQFNKDFEAYNDGTLAPKFSEAMSKTIKEILESLETAPISIKFTKMITSTGKDSFVCVGKLVRKGNSSLDISYFVDLSDNYVEVEELK